MSLIRDKAIVLTRLEYSETSQVLALFTREHGKVRVIAKGIQRGTKTRFAVGIDLLDLGDVVWSGRADRGGLSTLTEWKQTRALPGLREKLSRLYAAQYLAELTTRLTEDWDPHVELFEALAVRLTELSETAESLGPVVAYQQDLLLAIGSTPRFDACVMCGRESELTHFSSFEGGMVCRDCEPGQTEKREVSRATLSALRRESVPLSLASVFSLLNYHVAHLMGGQPALADKLVPPSQQRRT